MIPVQLITLLLASPTVSQDLCWEPQGGERVEALSLSLCANLCKVKANLSCTSFLFKSKGLNVQFGNDDFFYCTFGKV